MDAETINQLLDIGYAGGLILIIFGGFQEWWVYGPAHRRQMADKDAQVKFWRDMALGNQRVAERATDALPPGGQDAE